MRKACSSLELHFHLRWTLKWGVGSLFELYRISEIESAGRKKVQR